MCPGCAAGQELHSPGFYADVGTTSPLAWMSPEGLEYPEWDAGGSRAAHQLLLPSHNELSLDYGSVISCECRNYHLPNECEVLDARPDPPARTEPSWQRPRREVRVGTSSSLAF